MTVDTRNSPVSLRTEVFSLRCLTCRSQHWGSGSSSAWSVGWVSTSRSSHPTGANGLTSFNHQNRCRDLPLYYYKMIQGLIVPCRLLLNPPSLGIRHATTEKVLRHCPLGDRGRFSEIAKPVRGQSRSVSRGERSALRGASPPPTLDW